MDRQYLIDQVKSEYARLADVESREQYTGQQLSHSAEAYYEALLGHVIHSIEAGRFDQFCSGKEIVEAVANNKTKWGIPQ